MKVMVLVKATADSEAGVMPSPELLEAMEQLLQGLLQDIDKLLGLVSLGTETGNGKLDTQALIELLRSLKRLLATDLGGITPYMDRLCSGTVDTVFQSDVAMIAGAIDVFEIDEARTLVQSLLLRLQSAESGVD